MSEYEHNEHLLDEIQRLRESNFHLRKDCEEQKQRIKRLDYALHTAWHLISNVDFNTGKHSHMRSDFLNWMEKDLSPLMINRAKEANP